MSFSLQAVGSNEEVIKSLEAQAVRPPCLEKPVIDKAVELVHSVLSTTSSFSSDKTDRKVIVDINGHIDSFYGNTTVSIKMVNQLRG